MSIEFATPPRPLGKNPELNFIRILRNTATGEEFLVSARIEPEYKLSVDFAIYCDFGGVIFEDEDSKDENFDLGGCVKWDGCSNWRTDNGLWHCCGRDGIQVISDILSQCHDLAMEIFKEIKPENQKS